MKWYSIHIRDMSRLLHPASAAVPRRLPNLGLGLLTDRRALRSKVGAQSHGASRSCASVSDARLAVKPRAIGSGLQPRANVASRVPTQQLTRPQVPSGHEYRQQQTDFGDGDSAETQTNFTRLTPMLMTDYIKCQQLGASRQMTKANPYRVLSRYTARMDELCYAKQKTLDYMHISAILHGTARVCQSAAAVYSNWLPQEGVEQLHAFLSRQLVMLQQVMPDVRCRQASSIFWAFGRLHINPDDLVPGTVDALAQQFLADIASARGQSYASLLSACLELRLDPRGRVLPRVLQHLSNTDISAFNFQELANITHSLAKLPADKPTFELLDDLCNALLQKIQSNDARERPDAQAISSFAWALQKLKHEPTTDVAAGMLGHMLYLCNGHKRQQPTSQAISNLLLAWAMLRLTMDQSQADRLVTHLLQQRPQTQDLANTAWSLAVSGLLHIPAFGHLLHQYLTLITRQRPPWESIARQIAQLYNAMDWLRPQEGASLQYQQAYADLQTKLELLGPRPKPDHQPHYLSNLVPALAELGLQHHNAVQIKGYIPTAVVPPKDSTVKPLLFLVATDCFSNNSARLTGRAVFCGRLLSREGHVISIRNDVAPGSVEQLVDYLQPRLETVTAGKLDMYRV